MDEILRVHGALVVDANSFILILGFSFGCLPEKAILSEEAMPSVRRWLS